MFELEYSFIALGLIIAFITLCIYCYEVYKNYKEVKSTHEPKSPFKDEYKFEIFRDIKKEWRFRFVAPNGETMATSEGYKRHKDCLDSIESIQRNSHDAEIKTVSS